MSAWTIYWILQLDTIGNAMGLISFLGLLFVPLGWAFSIDVIKSLWAYVACSLATAAWAVAVMAAIFLPSTKTAAAMVIIPAIANNEAIQKEAGDLYQLAKQALREAVTDKAKEATEEASK